VKHADIFEASAAGGPGQLSGFYANVDDTLAQGWIEAGIALHSTETNEIIESAPVAPSDPVVEPLAQPVESADVHQQTNDEVK
jgi:hypothetical protein